MEIEQDDVEKTLDEKQNNLALSSEKTTQNEIQEANKDGLKNNWKIHLHNELLNEYQENQLLLSKCFPTLFPLGISVDDLGGSGPMSAILRRTLLLFYDRRFATNQHFIFQVKSLLPS